MTVLASATQHSPPHLQTPPTGDLAERVPSPLSTPPTLAEQEEGVNASSAQWLGLVFNSVGRKAGHLLWPQTGATCTKNLEELAQAAGAATPLLTKWVTLARGTLAGES